MMLKKFFAYLSVAVLVLSAVLTVSFGKKEAASADLTKFQIVYSCSDGDIVEQAAIDAAQAIGIEGLTVTSDAELLPQESGTYEILIGNTNRAESSKQTRGSDILNLDYIIKYDNNKIVIAGGSPAATADAVKCFTENFVSDGKAKLEDYIYRCDYSVKSVKVSGKSIKSYNAVSASTDNSYSDILNDFCGGFTELTGYQNTDDPNALNILFKCDVNILPDSYTIRVANGDITISGANSYGIRAAAEYFLSKIITPYTVLDDGDEFSGSIGEPTFEYSDYINYRTPLYNTYYKLVYEKQLNVVYFGGSVTSGHGSTDPESKSWRALCSRWLEQSFPGAQINSYSAFIGSSGSMLGAFRCGHDVISLSPDLVFIDFAVNDLYCETDAEDIVTYYESIIRQIRAEYPDCDIVSLYSADQSSVRSNGNSLTEQAYAQERVTSAYLSPSLNIGGGLCSSFDYTSDSEWANYFIDIAHPNDAGHGIYFEIIREFLEYELIYGNAESNELVINEMPGKISEVDFEPKFIPADKMEIVSSEKWEMSEESYWTTSSSYSGYYYPTGNGNYITVKFSGGNNVALFAQCALQNRLTYQFDGRTERIAGQNGNQPILLTPMSDGESEESHTLTISVNIKEPDTQIVLTGLLVW